MKNRRTMGRRWLAFCLALMMTMAMTVCSSGTADTTQETEAAEVSVEAEDTALFEPTPESASDAKLEKEEVVHVKADASGTEEEVTVNVTLSNPEDGMVIPDQTCLTDIRNSEGDEEYVLEEDGTLYWENHGEDIQYEGTYTGEVPVGVKITYELDGQKVSPEELAGQSGHVKIRFDYINNTEMKVKPEGSSKVTVHVPFLFITAALLDEEVFSNVEVTNGELVSMDDMQAVIGYALPYVADDLQLTDWEPTEEVDIPSYVEFSADVTDFSLDFTATMVSNGLLEDLENEDLEDADEMVDDMDDLEEASGELVDGTKELLDGMDTYRDYLKKYKQGVDAISTGMTSLNQGLQTMDKQKSQLADGVKAISDGLTQMDKSLASVEVPTGEGMDVDAIKSVASAFSSDAEALISELEALQKTVSEVQAYADRVDTWYAGEKKSVEAAESYLDQIDWSSIQSAAEKEAVKDAKNAAAAAMEGMEISSEEKEKILSKIESGISLDDITDQAKSKTEAALKELKDIPTLDTEKFTVEAEAIQTRITRMEQELEPLMTFADSIGDILESLTGMSQSIQTLKTSISALATGSSELVTGVEAFNEGISQAASGSKQLATGADTLSTSMASLISGFGSMRTGVKELHDGFKEFDEEGIRELTKLAGDDLSDVLKHLRGLREADQSYDTLTGLAEGHTGSVSFLIETDEIEK